MSECNGCKYNKNKNSNKGFVLKRKKIMLENIVQTEKESAEFEKYKALKGEYLYKQVSDILFELDGKPVSYSDVSSIIRYDKNLRDTLFIYLATFEEWPNIMSAIQREKTIKRLTRNRKIMLIEKLNPYWKELM